MCHLESAAFKPKASSSVSAGGRSDGERVCSHAALGGDLGAQITPGSCPVKVLSVRTWPAWMCT